MNLNLFATIYSTVLRPFSIVLICMLAIMPAAAQAQDAEALKARYSTLQNQLEHNQFQRPIHMDSSDKSGALQGEVYALIERPFSVVGPALQGMGHWCDILILHLNVKGCRSSEAPAQDMLTLNIGRKFDQPLADTQTFEFLYKVVQNTAGYLQLELNSDKGPLGTSQYRIVLEAVALDSERSFLHLSYSYAYGTLASMSMKGYLATIGRDKVGFSIVGHLPDDQPVYIDGMRGVVERNTMRYYLAIEAYLGALSSPESERLEKRLNDWHAGVERYPRQLKELERDEYLQMKRKEVKRQQSLASPKT